MFQEHARQATTAFRQTIGGEEPDDMRSGIAQFVSILLGKIDEILATEFSNPPSSLAHYSHTFLTTVHRGPPDIDRGYYFYGLLDITAQLSAVINPKMLPRRLFQNLIQLIEEHELAEFRWKAVSQYLFEEKIRIDAGVSSLRSYFPALARARPWPDAWFVRSEEIHRSTQMSN